jgi:outer membrane lipopolysaccharide assembly protein LptE/RlpB
MDANNRLRTLLILFCLIMASGCGYQLQATGQPIRISIASMAIPLMESPSSNIGFEGDFTKMIRREFVSHSQVPLVSKEKAAAVLIGKVTSIKTEPLSYRVADNTFDVTSSTWLKIKLQAKLVDATTGKIIWNDPNMQEKAAFTVDSDPLRTEYNQRRATKKIAQLLAERIYLKTMERF